MAKLENILIIAHVCMLKEDVLKKICVRFVFA